MSELNDNFSNNFSTRLCNFDLLAEERRKWIIIKIIKGKRVWMYSEIISAASEGNSKRFVQKKE